jgi:predicted DNA binding CopG/RHH family protein
MRRGEIWLYNANPTLGYESVVLQLHPKILSWAREEAEKQGVAYQTVINAVLLQQVS